MNFAHRYPRHDLLFIHLTVDLHVGHLIIDTESEDAHLSVLKGALVSCTISLPNGTTIGIYFNLDLALGK